MSATGMRFAPYLALLQFLRCAAEGELRGHRHLLNHNRQRLRTLEAAGVWSMKVTSAPRPLQEVRIA